MISKITSSEFEKLIKDLHPKDLESLVFDIFSLRENVDSLEFNPIIENRQFDLILSEDSDIDDDIKNHWAVEIKNYKSLIPIHVIEQFYTKVKFSLGSSYRMIFITTSGLTRGAQQFANDLGIEIWTIHDLFNKASDTIVSKYFSSEKDVEMYHGKNQCSKGEDFSETLKKIKPGKKDWPTYQQTIFDILEYIFCPPLEIPHYELIDSDMRNRRDIIFENNSKNEFWQAIRDVYKGHYIVVDAKNYSKTLTKRPIIDIAHYLKPYGCGMFGIIVSRKGSGKSSDHAIKEQWIGNQKMIVVLSDDDINEMLKIKKQGGNPEGVLRKKIANFRMRL